MNHLKSMTELEQTGTSIRNTLLRMRGIYFSDPQRVLFLNCRCKVLHLYTFCITPAPSPPTWHSNIIGFPSKIE